MSAEFLDYLNVVKAIYVYPGDRRFILEGEAFLNCLYFFLCKLGLVVVNDVNLRCLGLPFPDMNQSPGWKSPFSGYLLNDSGHYGSPPLPNMVSTLRLIYYHHSGRLVWTL
jgi:hypothetical protein